MFSNIDWKWLIVGLVLGWWVLPRIQGAVGVHASATKAAA
jgi:hypothetical protein